MIICGIKLTHDGSIALIDDDRLIFSYEMEKMNNNKRHSVFNLQDNEIEKIFNEYGYSHKLIDVMVVDGWSNDNGRNNKLGDSIPQLNEYDPLTTGKGLLDVMKFETGTNSKPYYSYLHISGHVIGAYCTSPFSASLESSFILVWDGAIGAQLYYFNAQAMAFENCGWIHFIYGDAYAEFANKFPPFTKYKMNDLSLAGKAMAYIAKGQYQKKLLKDFHRIYLQTKNSHGLIVDKNFCRNFSKLLQNNFLQYGKEQGHNPEDMILCFHLFLEELLIQELEKRISALPNIYKKNLCYAGGCALNIKWNSTIRSSGLFAKVWIPPFPNDSGSALGTACCEMVQTTNKYHLKWDRYSGPKLMTSKAVDKKWNRIQFSIKELAYLLYESNEPIVYLEGQAELGARALGHRSILASATHSAMKDTLNNIKEREDYRPIAPICIEEDAIEIFEPGTPDPLMLYEHKVRDDWQIKVPAVVHLDGSSRLQTVNQNDNLNMYNLLIAYKKYSGIPLLCNTSANLKGCGFFPDVQSAMNWGKCNFIWADQYLWYKENITLTKITKL